MRDVRFDVVMISAKQGGGKTTLARTLKRQMEKFDSRVHVIEKIFAGPIYEMHDFCRQILSDAGIDNKEPVKDGFLLQLLGTEWGRNRLGKDVWADILKARIEKLKAVPVQEHPYDHVIVVVPDLRFENEFHAIPDALTVRLECPEEVRKKRAEMWRENTSHPSEVGLDDYSARGMFDLKFNSNVQPPELMATLIADRLRVREQNKGYFHD